MAIMRRHPALLVLLTAIGAAAAVSTAGPTFYDDDPIARAPESRSAANAKPLDIDLFFEYSFNLFVNASRKPSNSRAGNLNTIDEVPDSSWFVNRIGTTPITAEQLARGVNSDVAPSPEKWVLLREKSAGTNPGFTARDGNGQTWFLQFDAPEFPEASTASVEIATKLFWALGYNMVETFITQFDAGRVEIDPKATVKRLNGERTAFTRDDMMRVLERAARNADGTYRASAGRLLPGKVLGPFRYSGSRSDDPNDLVPHQHRRELRALRVFGAWLNLVDWKAANTLDTIVEENGRSLIKHYLQDVGSSLGMANNLHEWDMGWEYYYDGPATKRRFLSYGFNLSPWQTVRYTEYPSIGLFEGDRFDPTVWKPQTPVEPYVELRADDAFWAARRVMAFSDDLIRAVVHVGRYSDPAAEAHLAAVLIKRRDAIGRAYLPAINPIVNPALGADGRLTFENAAVAGGFAEAPAMYRAEWSRFDNATGAATPIGRTESASTAIAGPRDLPAGVGTYVQADISAESAAHPTWQQPVRTHFRRTAGGWKLVGLERLPHEPGPAPPPAPKTPKATKDK
jgi:hypothetical protein